MKNIEIVKAFKKYFKTDINLYIDETYSSIEGRLVLDVFRFKDFLRSRGYDDRENIRKFITDKYGIDALRLIFILQGGEYSL